MEKVQVASIADIMLIRKSNKGIYFLLSATDLFNKYGWVVSLKVKKAEAITKTFQKQVKKSNYKPKKIQEERSKNFLQQISDIIVTK